MILSQMSLIQAKYVRSFMTFHCHFWHVDQKQFIVVYLILSCALLSHKEELSTLNLTQELSQSDSQDIHSGSVNEGCRGVL